MRRPFGGDDREIKRIPDPWCASLKWRIKMTCAKCNDTGYWTGGADMCVEFECDHIVIADEHTEQGWLIV